MIRRLYSDLVSFKNLEFTDGLNILLSEKSETATDRHTRNRAGKSSTVQLIHFLLGSNAGKDSLFRSPALDAYRFGMEFDLGGTVTRVERSGAKRTPLLVEGDYSLWPVKPRARDGENIIGNAHWKTVLGMLMFGIEPTEEKWTPSFRSLISYFVRKERGGGFHAPMQHSTMQQVADQQISISYLLGLDWSVPQAWQKVRDREKSLTQLKKSMKEGAFGPAIERASVLKTQLVVAQARSKRLHEEVGSFRVVAEYHQLEQEASGITRRLARLADDNTLDRRYIAGLEETSFAEAAPPPQDLHRLYEEAGVVLPDLVLKRFEDVEAFHASVIQNRRAYLAAELEAAKGRIADREREQRKLDERRAQVMSVLQSAGALDHFTALQAEVGRAETDVEILRQKHDAAEALESGSLRLRTERARLQERLHQDHTEQERIVNEAILTFQGVSASLYEDSKAGSLLIDTTDNGPVFEIEIQGSKSRGVSNMQIFCFDMMLTLLSLARGRSPGFLVHDSHLFDGVDDRQVGMALALGARLAEEHGFQYIVTMNTDDIPDEVPAGFRVEDHALDVRLSDATEDGGLFGFRFE